MTESIELGRQMIWFLAQRLVALAWIRQALGEAEAALEAMDDACRINPSPDTISIWHPGPSERARLLLAQGRVEEAARWTEERGLRPEDEVIYAREQDHLVLARGPARPRRGSICTASSAGSGPPPATGEDR